MDAHGMAVEHEFASAERQLLANSPDIPPGYGLADFVKLEQRAEGIVIALQEARFAWVSRCR